MVSNGFVKTKVNLCTLPSFTEWFSALITYLNNVFCGQVSPPHVHTWKQPPDIVNTV